MNGPKAPRKVSTLILSDDVDLDLDPRTAQQIMMNVSSDGGPGAITQIDEVPDDFLDTLQKFDRSSALMQTDNGDNHSRRTQMGTDDDLGSQPRRTPADVNRMRRNMKQLSSLELVSQPKINTTVIRSTRNSPIRDST